MQTQHLSESVETDFNPINRRHHVCVYRDNSRFIISLPWMHPDDGINNISDAKLTNYFMGALNDIAHYVIQVQKQKEPYALFYATHPNDELFKAPTYLVGLDNAHKTSEYEVSKLEEVLNSEKERLENKVSSWDSEEVDKVKLSAWGGIASGILLGLGAGIYFAVNYHLLHPNLFNLDTEIIAPIGFTLLGSFIGSLTGVDISMSIEDYRTITKQKLDVYNRLRIDKTHTS